MAKKILALFVIAILVPNIGLAASFNCADARQPIEETICSDKSLGKLDERMARYYFRLKEQSHGKTSDRLVRQQKAWLKKRIELCGVADVPCLKKVYIERILELRQQSQNIVQYKATSPRELQGVKGQCHFDESFPDDLKVYAGGSYAGLKLNNQIDDSGHQATQFEVIVNSPQHPVALILGAYEPSIWNIAWTKGTDVVAVVVTGYHRQALAGLPNGIPVINSSYHNRGPCRYLYVAEKNLQKINPLSNQAFDRNVTMVHYASKGKLVFGEQLSADSQLYTSKDNPPESFFDKSKPLAGQAGLRDLMAKGFIRPLNKEDLDRWAKLKAAQYADDLPPVASGSHSDSFRPRYVHNGYVILKQITIPAGLYGGNSATFFLEKGVPYPEGKLGHSALYDFNTLSCRGTVCRMK